MQKPKASLIYIDPSYHHFLNNGLFKLSDLQLNRDNQLLPFIRMKMAVEASGGQVQTADFLSKTNDLSIAEYYSLGLDDRFETVLSNHQASLEAFVIMEPPIVAPHLYAQLPRLTQIFKRVYLHNIEGDGYSLDNVDISKLRRLFWPLPYPGVLEPQWSETNRLNRAIVVNGNHKAWGKSAELYSVRIAAMVELVSHNCLDLYGMGWDKWWDSRSFWPPYFLNFKTLMSIYKGQCASKYEVMSRYDFSICIENMQMKGYISEKIFDCFYAGTIPMYFGAPDISTYIPQDTSVRLLKKQILIIVYKTTPCSYFPV